MPTEFVAAPDPEDFLDIPDTQSIDSNRFDVIERVREATSSPTPLTQFLQDPVVLETLTKSRHQKNRRGSSSSPHRRPHASTSMLSQVLAEEERQAYHLKSILRSTGDRLEYEIRRADEAAARAEYAEMRAKEAFTRAAAVEGARHHAEIESARLGEEIKRYRTELEGTEQELRRVKADLMRSEGKQKEAEESAAQARDVARTYQTALRDFQMREEGIERGQQLGMHEWFGEGHHQGWEAGNYEGRSDGFEEGIRAGRAEGLKEGREQGRKEERQNALHAFDKFLATETDDHDESRRERTRRWAASIYHSDEIRTTRSPTPRPTRRRDRSHGNSAGGSQV